MSEVYPLQDRIALVTGASSGLGRHFGLLLAANGAHVALAARSIDRVADTAKAITDQGGKALAVALDVTDRASVDAAVARIEDELGPIQILVNNAGVAARSEEHTSELQSLMRITYAVFCLKKKKKTNKTSRRNSKQHTTKHTTLINK